MSYLNQDRQADICPFLIMADKSKSMRGTGIEELNGAIPDLIRELRKDFQAAELARVGMFVFNDQAQELFPIGDPENIPTENLGLTASGNTAYGEGFKQARLMIERDLPSLGRTTYRPVLFVLSDGHHNTGSYQEPLRRLKEGWELRPSIVTFPFGEADLDLLRKVATTSDLCVDFRDATDRGQAVRKILDLVLNTVVEVTRTLSGEVAAENLSTRVARKLFEQYQPIVFPTS